MFACFQYLEGITRTSISPKVFHKKRQYHSFDYWCKAVDSLNYRLLGKYQIRWYANPVAEVVIKKYYLLDLDPATVTESDYKAAQSVELELESGEYDPDLLNEFDPPVDYEDEEPEDDEESDDYYDPDYDE